MTRTHYADSVAAFLSRPADTILGILTQHTSFALETTQRDAWLEQIRILHRVLPPYRDRGRVYFEYAVPRLGKRIDVVALIDHVIFVLEFKVGERRFTSHARDQVWDYALDLKNFHEPSHARTIAPVLVATGADSPAATAPTPQADGVLLPIDATPDTLASTIGDVLRLTRGPTIDAASWEQGRYCPTPTIIQAAMALYGGHSVAEISRSDASATNLTQTSQAVAEILRTSREHSQKCVCFVTGVPGAGKTLVGLDIATRHIPSPNSSSRASTATATGPSSSASSAAGRRSTPARRASANGWIP